MINIVQPMTVLTVSSGGSTESTVLNSICPFSGFMCSTSMVSSVERYFHNVKHEESKLLLKCGKYWVAFKWPLHDMQVTCLKDLSATLCRRDIKLQAKTSRLWTPVQSWVRPASQLTQAQSPSGVYKAEAGTRGTSSCLQSKPAWLLL